jgi:hypothetical protein
LGGTQQIALRLSGSRYEAQHGRRAEEGAPHAG